jgi:hypothetical protein
MAKVIVTSAHNFAAIADLAGSALENVPYHKTTEFRLDTGELEVPDVSQADLDTAFADYTANQVARDAAWAVKEADLKTASGQAEFDDREVLRAFAKLLVSELNILRAIEGLPPRTFAQLRTAIRDEIANP